MYSMQSVVRFRYANDGHYRSGWELPPSEILSRGLQTSALPAWLHAQAERRLPLVPLWPGFVIDTLLCFAALIGLRYLWTPAVRAVLTRKATAGGSVRHLGKRSADTILLARNAVRRLRCRAAL